MRSRILGILLATAIGGIPLAAAPTIASARDSFAVTFGVGNVAFAYRDGWWDRDHRFHHWRNGERNWYRSHYRTHYYGWDHDRDHDMGWHHRYW